MQVIADGIVLHRGCRDTHRRLQGALVRLATSALHRGFSREEWLDLLFQSDGGLVAQLAGGRRKKKSRRKPRTLASVMAQCLRAWKHALDRYSEHYEQYPIRVRENRQVIAAVIRSNLVDLTSREKAVLAVMADEMKSRGLPNVTMPVRQVTEALEGHGIHVTIRTTWNTLNRLVEKGVLYLVVRGKRGNSGKASIFTIDRSFGALVLNWIEQQANDRETIERIQPYELADPDFGEIVSELREHDPDGSFRPPTIREKRAGTCD